MSPDTVARPSRAQLVEEIRQFAEQITPADGRWQYAYNATAYLFTNRHGVRSVSFHDKSVKAIARLVGRGVWSTQYALRMIRDHGGIDGARARMSGVNRDPLAVSALEPWHLGHVYFAWLKNYPHVVKIGFSRRVHDRLEDIERSAHERIGKVQTQVGTAASESWWHHDWRAFRVDGEWFFDPRSADRTLPEFLREKETA